MTEVISATIKNQSTSVSPSAIEEAGKWHTRVFIISIVWFIVAAIVTAVITYLLWRANNKQQDAVTADAIARIAESKALASKADENAAKANERAAIANVEAGRANEKAGLANGHAQKLEGDNLQLRKDLEAATTESRAKQAELAKEQIKLAEEQRKTAEAQHEAAMAQLALKKHLEEVAERQKPRNLTPEQRAKLLDILMAGAKGTYEIIYVAGDPESKNFANQLAAVLKDAGWTLERMDSMLSADPIIGLMIVAQNTKNLRAAILQQALQQIRFPAAGELEQGRPEDYVRLVVGTKP